MRNRKSAWDGNLLKYTCASFFAGVGGIDLAFEMAGAKVIYANEMDARAIQTYALNFPIIVDGRDINEVNDNEIPNANIIIGGFPCQAFSIAGKRQGFNDEKGRGTLFFRLMKIIEKKQPAAIFLENVKNLVTHNHGESFKVICQSLKDAGYFVTYKVMNTMLYGNIPQNRERVYICAFRDKNAYDVFFFPKERKLTTKLSDVIDFKSEMPDKSLYYTNDSFGHYEALEKSITSMNRVYQWRRQYVRENKSGVCPTLTANMGTGGHNVPLVLTAHGIRKLTPRECFNLQGFPLSYKLPTNMANCHLYKQAGNSVSVSVIYRIAKEMLTALEESQKIAKR